MEFLRSLWRETPIFYRYTVSLFLKYLLLVVLITTLLVLFAAGLSYLNFAKSLSLRCGLEYTLTTAAVYTPLLLPLLELFAVALALYPLVKRKLNWVLFATGIPPREIVKPLAVGVLFPLILLLLHFQLLYPYAGYLQHLDYLRAKNKPLREGIVENFWYRKRNIYIHFDLIHLGEKKAYNGRLFEVDKDFHLKWVADIPVATFEVEGDEITVSVPTLRRYTPAGVKVMEHYRLEFPYEPKLLKVKNPSYFSTSELVQLVVFARGVGLNYYPYLWELVKRFLLVFATFVFPLLGGIYFFSSTDRKQFLKRMLMLFIAVVVFYIGLLMFQSLVVKVSLNPLYGLLLAVPYLLWLIVEIKRN